MTPTLKILYGPPGTGKTWNAVREAVRCIDPDSVRRWEVGELSHSEIREVHDGLVERGQILWVTFHPSYSYEDFVEGFRPTTVDGQIRYEVVDGPLLHLCDHARGTTSRLRPGLVLQEGRGRYVIDSCSSELITLRIVGAEEKARRPIARATIDSIVTAIREERLTLDDLKYGKGAGVASAARDKVSKATDIDGFYLADEAPIRALVNFALRAEIQLGEVLKDAQGKGRFRVLSVDEGGWLLESKPARSDQVGVTQERYVSRHVVERLLELGIDPGAFSLAGTTLYNPADLGIPEDGLPEPGEGEERGKRKGSILKRYAGELTKLSSTEFSNAAHVRAVYERITGPARPTGPRDCVLVIDEVNRADLSRVFGEAITLLEPDKRIGAAEPTLVRLPYSGRSFGIPMQLSVIATMNTADRSLTAMDFAMRRRFSFVEAPPLPDRCPSDYGGLDLETLLTKINERVAVLRSRECMVGHSFLMEEKLEEIREAQGWPGSNGKAQAVAAVLRTRVVPLLLEYFHEDWRKVEVVLGAATGGFGKSGKLKLLHRIEADVAVSEFLRDESGPEEDGSFFLAPWWDPAHDDWAPSAFLELIQAASK